MGAKNFEYLANVEDLGSILASAAVCTQDVFMGSGSMFGLVNALTGECLPRYATYVAVGNGLNQGPLLFHFPQELVERISDKAASDPDFHQLWLDMWRWFPAAAACPLLLAPLTRFKPAMSATWLQISHFFFSKISMVFSCGGRGGRFRSSLL